MTETTANAYTHQASGAESSGGGCPVCGDHGAHGNERVSDHMRLAVAVFGGLLVLNSFIANAFLSKYLDAFAIELSAIVGALILGLPILYAAARDLVSGHIYMNEPVALALIAAFASGQYRTAGVVAFLMLITITVEKRTAVGAEQSIEELIKLTPSRARRIVDGQEEDIDVFDLKKDDVFRVRPGENFPADGIILSGSSTVNQATITGESLPTDKEEGQEVYAGTQNLTGAMDVRVTRVGTDTTLGKVRELIAAAERTRLPVMRVIDRYAGYYTPTILIIAALVWFFTHSIDRVIAVLVMSCPCAIVIASPSAVIAAITSAARLGVLIKDASHIELAAKIKAVIFDKTGTLTEGRLEVARLQPAENVELADLLYVATTAECHSNHPAAQAMRVLAGEAEISWGEPRDYTEMAGRGVQATVDGDVLRVGRESWLRECGLDTGVLSESLQQEENTGMSVVFVARNDQVLGWIGLRDAIRDVARDAVTDLKELGIRQCAMFTGDNQQVADTVGRQLGINHISAEALPQEKVDFVQKLKDRGYLVAVVGDGVNDAPALASGNIGVAMGAIGSDVAVHSASIGLMNNDLRRIPFLLWLSRRAYRLMHINLLIGLTFIIGGIYLSIIGWISAIIAAVLHASGTLLIIFNSARLVRAGEELEASAPAGDESGAGDEESEDYG